MKKKPWYAYNLADDGRSATIRINGVIGNRMEGRTIESLDYELKWAAESVNEIIIRITSFGGSLAEALAMYGALRRHPARKVAIIEGVAASAGTIVAMAADEIRIYANASMMVHGVSLVTEDGEEVEDAEAARVLNASIIETYAARTGKTADDLADAIATDTWMTAREAVAAGWADSVIEIAEQGAAVSATAASPLQAIAAALEIPADVIARATAQAAAAIKEAREIRDLCAFASAADRAGGFIRQRLSLDQVRAELINALAANADERHTDTHPRAHQPGQPSRPAVPTVSVDSIYAALNRNVR